MLVKCKIKVWQNMLMLIYLLVFFAMQAHRRGARRLEFAVFMGTRINLTHFRVSCNRSSNDNLNWKMKNTPISWKIIFTFNVLRERAF